VRCVAVTKVWLNNTLLGNLKESAVGFFEIKSTLFILYAILLIQLAGVAAETKLG
jgi:hypothetical protein